MSVKDYIKTKFNKKGTEEAEKNKKIASDEVRIRIHRLNGNLPSEIFVGLATIKKDKYNNSIMVDEVSGFREEFPNLVDPLVSDIKSKLNSYTTNREEQIVKVEANIKKKEKILSRVKDGRLRVPSKDSGEVKEVNINVESEKANLNLLRTILYVLKKKNPEGSFEKIEVDGVRSLSYLIHDGELLPYWNNTPTINSEPVGLTSDMSLRKKYFYDNEKERLDDLRDLVDSPTNRILKVIMFALIIVVALANIGWSVYLHKVGSELRDESLIPELDRLEFEIVKVQQECSDQLANQVTNNGVVIDWATLELKKAIALEEQKQATVDKANAQI